MPYLLQIDFPYPGPWGDGMCEAMSELAHAIAAEAGLIWKIWTENPETGESGGIYLFHDRQSAEAYQKRHVQRLADFGISNIRAKVFAVHEALSKIDRAPL
jgi:hypothetical protein